MSSSEGPKSAMEDQGAVRFHGLRATVWEEKYKKKSFGARFGALQQILEGVDLTGRKWLDAGCGTGTLSRWLAQRGATVLGVDASPDMVRIAGELAARHPMRNSIRFELIENVEGLDLPSESFDGILCSSVLEYLNSPERCLASFQRVLRKDGILLVSAPNAKSVVRNVLRLGHRITGTFGRAWPEYLRHSRNHYSRDGFKNALRTCGFIPLKSVIFGGPLPAFFGQWDTLGSLILVMAEKK